MLSKEEREEVLPELKTIARQKYLDERVEKQIELQEKNIKFEEELLAQMGGSEKH